MVNKEKCKTCVFAINYSEGMVAKDDREAIVCKCRCNRIWRTDTDGRICLSYSYESVETMPDCYCQYIPKKIKKHKWWHLW